MTVPVILLKMKAVTLRKFKLILTLETYTFSHNYGVKDKETQKIVATTPSQAIDLLNKLYNINLNEDTVGDYFELIKELKQHLSKEDLHAVFDTYLRILDSTRADIPDDLQQYWIDIITLFKGTDKTAVKQQIIDTVTSLPTSIIVPFKSDKYKGRKYYNSGELISVLFPITGAPGQFIQVDNIIALSKEEHNFKNMFLDLPAEKQGLLIGLVKTVLLEEQPKDVFRKLGITKLPPLEENEKLENFKELSREIIWSTADWNLVEKLLQSYNIDSSFEELLNEISAKLKNPRSKKRVAGIFKGMVSVKSGEVGTPKGANKERAIKLVTQKLSEHLIKPLFNINKSFSKYFTEAEDNTPSELIVIFAGRFQPFHQGHAQYYKRAKQEFPSAKFFIATASNTSKGALKEPEKYPFSFNEKKEIIAACGIPENEIIETRSPYEPVEILSHFNPNLDRVMFLVGKKDMKNDPRFSFNITKSGKPSYFQPFKSINHMVPFNKEGGHGYIYAPSNITFNVDGHSMTSASEFRNLFKTSDEKTRKRMIIETIGHFDQGIYELFVSKLG